jgi:hypothetical protein
VEDGLVHVILLHFLTAQAPCIVCYAVMSCLSYNTSPPPPFSLYSVMYNSGYHKKEKPFYTGYHPLVIAVPQNPQMYRNV